MKREALFLQVTVAYTSKGSCAFLLLPFAGFICSFGILIWSPPLHVKTNMILISVTRPFIFQHHEAKEGFALDIQGHAGSLEVLKTLMEKVFSLPFGRQKEIKAVAVAAVCIANVSLAKH